MYMRAARPIAVGAAALLAVIVTLFYVGSMLIEPDPCERGDGRATVQPNGDSVCLQGVATVTFPAGSFAAPTDVTLQTTAEQDVAKLFKDTTAMFMTAGRLGYELRIGTGAVPPQSADVQVTMPVPEELQSFLLTGHTLEAFAAIERGDTPETASSMFEFMQSRFDATTSTISFRLPKIAFAANDLTRGDYQAIVTLAPTLSGADCH